MSIRTWRAAATSALILVSISVVVPLLLFYVVAGIIWDPLTAMVVCLLGVNLGAYLCYLLARLGVIDVPSGISTFSSRHRAYVKVQDGCDLRCSYCLIWRARGPAS